MKARVATVAALATVLLSSTTVTPTARGAATAATAATAWTPPPPTYRLHDAADGDAMQILPAGENGLVTATELVDFEATGTRPPHSSDQLSPYQDLLWRHRPLTDRSLHDYFIDDSFGVPRGEIERTERPSPSVKVVIYRGRHDIPHIYGASLSAMAYGAGYAAAEDRLFLMDVLRHYGEGDLASFVGPSCSIEDMDHDQLLAAGYSKAQLNRQLTELPEEYGAAGRTTVAMIDSYVAGINRYIADSRTDPALVPADYAATGGPPQDWTPADVVGTASLIGTEATGGGSELVNAGLLTYLDHRLGRTAGHRAFTAFHSTNDRSAPTTITDRRFPYEIPRRLDPRLTAIPDHPRRPLTGGPTDTTPHCDLSHLGLARSVSRILAPGSGESNALVVSGRLSRDHDPIAVFGPELGYYAPQVLMEEDLHAPGYDAAGSAFPGASFVITIGRARHFAWSATTASTDQNDIRVERLCSPGGGSVPEQATHYVDRGRCRAMTERTFTETAFTKPGGTGAPVVITHRLFFTRAGVVEGWTTLHHRPVAIVDQRSTFMHEADSLVGLLKWGEPGVTGSPRSFIRNAAPISYSFNWFYIGTHHTAYVVSGRDPVRNPHADPELPTWGTGVASWRGLLPAARHPHEIDPPSGAFMSWNNKPAPGFAASDDMYGWGPTHRVQLIAREFARIRRHHHGLTRADLVTAVEQAATEDLSGEAVVRPLLRYLGPLPDSRLRKMTRLLSSWAAGGAHRRAAGPTSTTYQAHDAIAIWDQAYPQIIEALFNPLLGNGGLAHYDGLPSAYRVLPMEFALTPNGDGTHHGDGYYVGWEGYVVRALEQLEGRHPPSAFPPAVLDRLCGAPSRCRARIRRTLLRVGAQLTRINGSTRIRTWAQDTATKRTDTTQIGYDRIVYFAAGIVSQPDMEWQNRPTYQQVVEFPR